jgi:hypothetical protein
MPIHMTCPDCGTAYAFSEQLAGRTARCQRCDHPLTVGSPPPADEPDVDFEPRRRRKKKARRRDQDPAALAWKLAIGAGVLLVLVVGGAIALAFVLVGGTDKGPRLVGKWRGAAEDRPAVGEAVKDKVHPVAQGLLEALAQRAADELLEVRVEFKKGGTAFFSGNTASIGVPPDSDGPWEVVARDGDVLTVRLAPSGATFEARLAFRDPDTFTLTRLDQKDKQPLVFTRVKD